jgi:hypothetical protein
VDALARGMGIGAVWFGGCFSGTADKGSSEGSFGREAIRLVGKRQPETRRCLFN